MNPLALFIAQSTLHGRSVAEARASYERTHGTVRPAQWAAAMRAYHSIQRVRAGLERGSTTFTLAELVRGEQVGRGVWLRVRVILIMTDSDGMVQHVPVDVVCNIEDTVSCVLDDARDQAAEKYGYMQLDSVLILPGARLENYIGPT